MKSVRTVAMYFPEASASRYEIQATVPRSVRIYNKSIYMKVRETRLLITIHNFEFCRIPGIGNK